MKAIIILLMVFLLTLSCAMVESTVKQKEFLQNEFPNCIVVEDEYVALRYNLIDTVDCNIYVVELSSYKRGTIISIISIIRLNQ